MKTLEIDLFKAQNTAPREAYQLIADFVEACRRVGYVRSDDEYKVTISWPFVGPAEDKYAVLTEHGVPKSCMKLRRA